MLLMPSELLDSALTTETPQPIAALVETAGLDLGACARGPERTAPLIVVLGGHSGSGKPGDDSAVGGGVWG